MYSAEQKKLIEDLKKTTAKLLLTLTIVDETKIDINKDNGFNFYLLFLKEVMAIKNLTSELENMAEEEYFCYLSNRLNVLKGYKRVLAIKDYVNNIINA